MINSHAAKLPYISFLEDRVSNATTKKHSLPPHCLQEKDLSRMAPGLTMNRQAQILCKYKQKESGAGNINLGQFQGQKY